MANWRYDAKRHVYIAPNGDVVSFAEIVRVRDGFIVAREEMARALVRSYVNGDITLDVWEREFRALTAETFTALHMFGSGGEAAFRQKPRAVEMLTQLLERQIPYADQFVSDVRAGGVSAEQMESRAVLYQGSAVEAYEQAKADDWGISLPYYPADGQTDCHSNCRCSWEITTNWDEGQQRDVTVARWQTEGDDKVCDGCQERADAWPGNVIA